MVISGGMYPAAFLKGVTIATFLPTDLTSSASFSSTTTLFSDGEIPLPDFWGGYRVVPKSIEFWQGRENRLHDRFTYELRDSSWNINRLSP